VTRVCRLSKSYASLGGSDAYDVLASGRPVVLLHGSPSWSYMWREVARTLNRRRFPIHPPMRTPAAADDARRRPSGTTGVRQPSEEWLGSVLYSTSYGKSR
jgi:pimeloyl-ACP methyl ester carboxylesterase